ncbi:hypothetical protein CITRIK5_70554 [Citricoccus sp. K5]|nr:hypothetical protein CITRIK5_70554 [Citricoccus sp. K5]
MRWGWLSGPRPTPAGSHPAGVTCVPGRIASPFTAAAKSMNRSTPYSGKHLIKVRVMTGRGPGPGSLRPPHAAGSPGVSSCPLWRSLPEPTSGGHGADQRSGLAE